jgi:hypothetical protein
VVIKGNQAVILILGRPTDSSHKSLRAEGVGWTLEADLASVVSQNQPAMIEMKGVKTSHFMERETAPVTCLDAGLIGQIKRLQREPSNHDIQSARSRMVPATHCPGTRNQSGNDGSVFALGKIIHFDDRL